MGFRGRDAAPGAHRHADAVQLDFAQQTRGHRQQFGFFGVRLISVQKVTVRIASNGAGVPA